MRPPACFSIATLSRPECDGGGYTKAPASRSRRCFRTTAIARAKSKKPLGSLTMTHAVEAGHAARTRRTSGADTFGADGAPADLIDGERAANRRTRYCELIAIAQMEMDRLHEQIRGSGYAVVLTDALGAVLYEKLDSSTPDAPLERMGPGVAVRGP